MSAKRTDWKTEASPHLQGGCATLATTPAFPSLERRGFGCLYQAVGFNLGSDSWTIRLPESIASFDIENPGLHVIPQLCLDKLANFGADLLIKDGKGDFHAAS